MGLTYSDDFSIDTSADYESDYFVTGGSGVPIRTITVTGGRMEDQDYGNGAYNDAIFRRKVDYEIPASTDFDFTINVNRRSFDSYNLGITFWNDANRTKFLDVFFGDYGNSSIVVTQLETKYNGAPTDPTSPITIRVRRVGSTYTCWIAGTQIYDGAISELSGENLRYGVKCDVTSGPTVTANASYDNWNMVATDAGSHGSDTLSLSDAKYVTVTGTISRGTDTAHLSDSANIFLVGGASGTIDRDTFWVNDSGTWREFKDFSYFHIKKVLNQMSEFEVTTYDIQDDQKVYFKEQAEIIFFVGTTKILKGRIQTIEYASAYECTAKGFGMEVKLLDKDFIKDGDKRIQYTNESAQAIAKQILSVNSDGVSPWIINPGTDGLFGIDIFTGYFAGDYGNVTLRFEYANRLNCIGLLCNAIDYEWEVYQDASYSNNYMRIKSLIGNQTSVKTFNIAGDNANCTRTERNVDINNMVNFVDVLGYGDGINQIKTSIYNSSPKYSTLTADVGENDDYCLVTDGTDLVDSYAIKIGNEIITVDDISGNQINFDVRGYGGTTQKSHKKNTYVGCMKDSGTWYYPESPQEGSSIATYGLMDYVLINRDIMDIDTLEVIASGYLLERMTPIISIKIISNEPTIDVALLNLGDKVTVEDEESGITGEFRIVGLEYEDDYGNISLEISVSNRSLEFIEQMNKAREDQQNMQKYMQGATNIYAITETTEGDVSNYIDIRFFMPEEAVALNKVLLNFKMKPIKIMRVITDSAVDQFSENSLPTTFANLDGSVTVNVGTGNKVLIMHSSRLHTNSSDDLLKLRLTRNGTIVDNSQAQARVDDGTFDMTVCRVILETPGTGSFTYVVQGESSSGTGDCFDGYLVAIVFSTGFEQGLLTNPSVNVYVGEDGGTMTLVGTYTTDQSNLDITSICEAVGTNKWINMEFRPNQEMSIEANAYVQMFLESK